MNEYYRLAKEKWDAVAKPLDGMGEFEHILCKIAAIQETTDIQIEKRDIFAVVRMHCPARRILHSHILHPDISAS